MDKIPGKRFRESKIFLRKNGVVSDYTSAKKGNRNSITMLANIIMPNYAEK